MRVPLQMTSEHAHLLEPSPLHVPGMKVVDKFTSLQVLPTTMSSPCALGVHTMHRYGIHLACGSKHRSRNVKGKQIMVVTNLVFT